MAAIFVLVNRASKTFGQGDFGTADELASVSNYGPTGPHPAFVSRQAAEDYREQLGLSGANLKIVVLELRSD